ncbi:MAG: hypothetical protein VYD90_09190 [Pseudomonadota bacterium]|nr:hypothetical protein [Pseudomonadota bacterium]
MTLSPLRLVLLVLVAMMALAVCETPLVAQPTGPDAAPENAPEVAPAAQRAARIQALLAGNLDPAVDAHDLFGASLIGQDTPRLRLVARMVEDRDFYARAARDPAALDGLPPAQAQLALAEAAFLRLSDQRRRTLLASHEKAHRSFREAAAEKSSQAQELTRLKTELAALEAFLKGEAVPPGALDINLLDAANNTGQMALLRDTEIPDEAEPAEDASPALRIAWLKDQVALARRTIFRLPPDRLVQLAAASGVSSRSAQEVAQADARLKNANTRLDKAEQDARDAASEHERLVASERARLLKTEQAQAKFRADLVRGSASPDTVGDNALAWRRRALEAAEAGPATADALYPELVAELTKVRGELQAALEASEALSTPGLIPPALDRALSSDAPETRALETHRAALERDAALLTEAHAQRLWQQRSALREAMNLMNGARITLLHALSGSMRGRVTGFGPEGVAQVRREVFEIVLELRFNLQAWRHTASDLLARVTSPSPAFVLAVLRLMLIAMAFAWWRRRGDALLARAQMEAALKRPRTVLRSLQSAALQHWRCVRAPLDWLLLACVLWWLWPEDLALAGLRFLWIVVFWSLATVVTVRLVNELARGRGQDDPRAALRWKSLRLIAGSLLAIGLMLNLTRASVGEGAIYNWVVTIAWLLVPVVAVLLARWWRARIVSLAAADAGDSALLRWIARDPGGVTGVAGRIAVGVLLLAKGVRAVIARRVRDVALVREMLEQRARIAAERQVAEDKASGRFHRLPPETLAVFDPHRPPSTLRLGTERPGHLPMPPVPAGSLTLFVGERGLGKSSYLRDLARQSGKDMRHVHLEVPPCPPADWVERLPDQLAQESTGAAPLFITIDDIQRLITPAIGGLATLDRLIGQARHSCEDGHAWVFAISDAAWRFLQRARSERILFDAIHTLPVWTADELRALIERRSTQAGIAPDFSAMVDDGVFEFGEDVSVTERRKRGYFERLAEHVGGNPAIALDYWRRSLFVEAVTGTVTVRTFDTPPTESLAALPMPALFVLRVLLQMDFADKAAIHASTDLSDMQISDALRRLERMGAVTQMPPGYQIALNWWTTVARLLARQNLIVRETR